jgi:DNA-binding response OmpR family regulator
MRVLLAEDDANLREMLTIALQRRGYNVEVAEDGLIALRKFRLEGPFDIVVSDYQMPRKNGMSLLSDIRELEPSTRMILQTATTGLAQLMERAGLGDVPVLNKPYRMNELFEILDGKAASGSS